MRIQPISLPKPVRAAELVVDGPLVAELASINVRRDDKVAFDQVQAWLSLRAGRRLTQWEAFTMLLSEASQNEGGALDGLETWV